MYWKVIYTERRRDKEEDLLSYDSLCKWLQWAGAEPIQSEEPGTSSSSATRVQGSKALGYPRLLSQATSRSRMRSGAAGIRTGAYMGSRHV